MFERTILRPAVDIQQINDIQGKLSDGYYEDFLSYKQDSKSTEQFLKAPWGVFEIGKGGYLDVNKYLESVELV